MLSMGTDQRMAIVTCGSHGGSLLNDLDRWCWGMKKGLPSPEQFLSSRDTHLRIDLAVLCTACIGRPEKKLLCSQRYDPTLAMHYMFDRGTLGGDSQTVSSGGMKGQGPKPTIRSSRDTLG